MSAAFGPHEPLVGRFVRLDPLQDSDLAELAPALGSADVFAGGWGGGPGSAGASPEGFAAFCRRYLPWSERPYVVRLAAGPDTGRAVGTTSMYEINAATESATIGYTAYDPRVWATAVNPECKLLLLRDAFGHGFGRITLRADDANARSKAAITKLGAHLDGVWRRERRRADGSWRDAATYSILATEFPAIEAALIERVGRQDTPPAL